jgi:hypothetical protein
MNLTFESPVRTSRTVEVEEINGQEAFVTTRRGSRVNSSWFCTLASSGLT